MPICGGNGMGFYNFDHRLRICGFPPPDWLEGRRGAAFLVACSLWGSPLPIEKAMPAEWVEPRHYLSVWGAA